jgi:hypothetical protein
MSKIKKKQIIALNKFYLSILKKEEKLKNETNNSKHTNK